jgi:hypothetical protein
MMMDKSELRALVFSALRSQPQTHFDGVKSRLRNLSVEYETADDLLVHEILWELLIQGILSPGMNASNLDLPYLHVTEYGLQVLQANKFLPYDYDGYMANLEASNIRPMDPAMDIYVRQSVLLFASGHYLASTAMLGISVERCIDLLVDAYKDLWRDASVKSAFEQRLSQAGRNLKQRFGLLRHALQGMNLPTALNDSFDSLLSSLYTIQRYSRDEFGNATGLPVDRDIAHANLLIFPTSWNRVDAIIQYFESLQAAADGPTGETRTETQNVIQPAADGS